MANVNIQLLQGRYVLAHIGRPIILAGCYAEFDDKADARYMAYVANRRMKIGKTTITGSWDGLLEQRQARKGYGELEGMA